MCANAWQILNLFSIRAAAGKLDGALEAFAQYPAGSKVANDCCKRWI
jgi:hypothetical protein